MRKNGTSQIRQQRHLATQIDESVSASLQDFGMPRSIFIFENYSIYKKDTRPQSSARMNRSNNSDIQTHGAALFGFSGGPPPPHSRLEPATSERLAPHPSPVRCLCLTTLWVSKRGPASRMTHKRELPVANAFGHPCQQ